MRIHTGVQRREKRCGKIGGRNQGLEKKGPGGAFAATEADQPGMGMTNRVCPLREKSGERFTARRIRWGCPMKVPAPPRRNVSVETASRPTPALSGPTSVKRFENLHLLHTAHQFFAIRPSATCNLRSSAAHRDTSMGLIPIKAYAYIDFQRHRKFGSLHHMSAQLGDRGLDRFLGHFEHELVMHLHDEPRRRVAALEP